MGKSIKFSALLLAAIMSASLLAGCSGGPASASSNASASGSSQSKEPTPISWLESDMSWGGSRDSALQQAFIEVVEKNTNTKITPIIPPHSSVNDKLATLVSSGDAPDMFLVYQAMQRLSSYAIRENIIPLDDYIKKSEKLSKIDKSLFEYIKVNGKTYYVPKSQPQTKCIYLRKDIADKYGIKLSSKPTTDEFVTEMKKLVGKDIIPFCFPKWLDNFQFFYNSFGAYGGIYQDASGKYVDGFQTQEMKDALLYIRKLYTEKIMDQEFITNENAKMRENVYKGLAASAIDYTTNYTTYNTQSEAAGAPTEYIPIYQIVGPTGKGGGLNEAIGTAYVVSSKCKTPEAAMRVIEFVVATPEGVMNSGIGVKGKHYEIAADGTAKATELAASSGYKFSPSFYYSSLIKVPELGFKWDATTEKNLAKQEEIIKGGIENYGPCYATPAGKSDTHDRVSPSIKSTRETIASKVVLGTATIEEAYKEYDAFWKSINGDLILQELNK